MSNIVLEGGKYTVLSDGGVLRALRNGEPWRDLTGDKLVGALVDRIDELEAAARAPLLTERAEPAVRYCYECGHIGEVDYTKHRDCCPDGNHARYVHPKIAEQAQCGTGAYVKQLSERTQ